MKRLHLIFLILFALLFSSLIGILNKPNAMKKDYADIAHEILLKTGHSFEKKYSIKLMGITEGYAGKINVIGLSYRIIGPQKKDELRKILVDCVEALLSAMNSNVELRPHLKKYPLTTNEVECTLFIHDLEGREVVDPYISVAGVENGKIVYRTSSSGNSLQYKKTEKENYEEALSIVRTQ